MIRWLCPVIPAVGAACAAGLLAALAACGNKSTSFAPSITSSDPLPGIETMLAEKSMGDPAAPIVMIEYSALNCTFCAGFHIDTLPLIKSEYIDTGKVRFVYRDFPLDYSGGLTASMVGRCAGDRYFTVIDLIYRQQAAWVDNSNVTAALKAVVAPAGLTAAEVDACLASSELRNGVLAMRASGQYQYGVQAVPTFLINGNVVQGALPYGSFAIIFNSLLQ